MSADWEQRHPQEIVPDPDIELEVVTEYHDFRDYGNPLEKRYKGEASDWERNDPCDGMVGGRSLVR